MIRVHSIGTLLLAVTALLTLVPVTIFSIESVGALELWSSHFSEMPEMVPLMEKLARHHRVVLLSNTNEAHWSHVTRHYRVLGCAHGAYVSYQLGVMKPDPASFRRVMDGEGRSPGECVFIDDRDPNVNAARDAGMTAIAFTNRNELKRRLSTCGIDG